MAVKSVAKRGKRLAQLGAVGLLVSLSGCCGNLLISERFGHDVCGEDLGGRGADGSCTRAAGSDQDDSHTAAGDAPFVSRPALSLPTFCWPGWLSLGRLHAHHHRFKQEVGEMLQPGPPPPVKPPHSRFHPVPTQPAFAHRATYTPPELAGITPEDLRALKEAGAQHAAPSEDVLTPVPDQPEFQRPRAQEPPMPEPALPLVPPPPAARPPARPPAILPTDPSKGPIDPVTYRWHEPNPLRAPAVKAR